MVKPAQVSKQLKKKETGALAAIGKQQQRQLEAAVKIQAAMRGRLNRTKSTKSTKPRSRRDSSRSDRSDGSDGGGGGKKSRRRSRRLS